MSERAIRLRASLSSSCDDCSQSTNPSAGVIDISTDLPVMAAAISTVARNPVIRHRAPSPPRDSAFPRSQEPLDDSALESMVPAPAALNERPATLAMSGSSQLRSGAVSLRERDRIPDPSLPEKIAISLEMYEDMHLQSARRCGSCSSTSGSRLVSRCHRGGRWDHTFQCLECGVLRTVNNL